MISINANGDMISIPTNVDFEKLDEIELENYVFACVMATIFTKDKEKHEELRRVSAKAEKILDRHRLVKEL